MAMRKEERLAAALRQRTFHLLEAARVCVQSALDSTWPPTVQHTDTLHLWATGYATDHLRAADALTAACALRSGKSWSKLAEGTGVTRQTLHQRLRTASEDAYEAAQAEPLMSSDLSSLVAEIRHLLDQLSSDGDLSSIRTAKALLSRRTNSVRRKRGTTET